MQVSDNTRLNNVHLVIIVVDGVLLCGLCALYVWYMARAVDLQRYTMYSVFMAIPMVREGLCAGPSEHLGQGPTVQRRSNLAPSDRVCGIRRLRGLAQSLVRSLAVRRVRLTGDDEDDEEDEAQDAGMLAGGALGGGAQDDLQQGGSGNNHDGGALVPEGFFHEPPYAGLAVNMAPPPPQLQVAARTGSAQPVGALAKITSFRFDTDGDAGSVGAPGRRAANSNADGWKGGKGGSGSVRAGATKAVQAVKQHSASLFGKLASMAMFKSRQVRESPDQHSHASPLWHIIPPSIGHPCSPGGAHTRRSFTAPARSRRTSRAPASA